MSKAKTDPVKAFLQSRGAPAHLIKAGLEGLIRNWSRAVGGLAGKEEVNRDAYLNDLDGRQLIAEVLKIAPAEQIELIQDKLDIADEAFEELTKKNSKCIWGKKAAKENRWTARKNPWYYAVPKEAKLV